MAQRPDDEDSGDHRRIARRDLARLKSSRSSRASRSRKTRQVRIAGAGSDQGSGRSPASRRAARRDRYRCGRQQHRRGARTFSAKTSSPKSTANRSRMCNLPRRAEQSRSANAASCFISIAKAARPSRCSKPANSSVAMVCPSGVISDRTDV